MGEKVVACMFFCIFALAFYVRKHVDYYVSGYVDSSSCPSSISGSIVIVNVPADFALDATLALNQTGRQVGELELQNSDFNNFANFAHDCSSIFAPKSPIGQ